MDDGVTFVRAVELYLAAKLTNCLGSEIGGLLNVW
jgi:hypothetical protein